MAQDRQEQTNAFDHLAQRFAKEALASGDTNEDVLAFVTVARAMFETLLDIGAAANYQSRVNQANIGPI